jgi:type IV secretion system protein VirD4
MPIHESPWVDQHDSEDVENYAEYFQGIAASVADLLGASDSRTADSFLTGAQQALARFNITTHAHKKTKRSTFRFAEQKEGNEPTTVFIMLDPNKINAQAPVLGLILWGMLHEIKQHENKHRPVYLLADEATNIPFGGIGIGSLITWARAYGLRLFFCFQTFPAFRDSHGKEALEILLSECEIRQFLPGQRNPETLVMIEKMLAQQSLVVQSHSGSRSKGAFGLDGYGYKEEGRPLMTADEIRRTDKTILFIRNNKPMLVDTPSIAAIAPWRKQIGISPFYGEPYLQRVTLHLKGRDGSLLGRAFRAVIRKLTKGTRR